MKHIIQTELLFKPSTSNQKSNKNDEQDDKLISMWQTSPYLDEEMMDEFLGLIGLMKRNEELRLKVSSSVDHKDNK